MRQQTHGPPARRAGALQGISRHRATGTGYRQRGLGHTGPRPPPIGVQIRLADEMWPGRSSDRTKHCSRMDSHFREFIPLIHAFSHCRKRNAWVVISKSERYF